MIDLGCTFLRLDLSVDEEVWPSREEESLRLVETVVSLHLDFNSAIGPRREFDDARGSPKVRLSDWALRGCVRIEESSLEFVKSRNEVTTSVDI